MGVEQIGNEFASNQVGKSLDATHVLTRDRHANRLSRLVLQASFIDHAIPAGGSGAGAKLTSSAQAGHLLRVTLRNLIQKLCQNCKIRTSKRQK